MGFSIELCIELVFFFFCEENMIRRNGTARSFRDPENRPNNNNNNNIRVYDDVNISGPDIIRWCIIIINNNKSRLRRSVTLFSRLYNHIPTPTTPAPATALKRGRNR